MNKAKKIKNERKGTLINKTSNKIRETEREKKEKNAQRWYEKPLSIIGAHLHKVIIRGCPNFRVQRAHTHTYTEKKKKKNQ